MSGWQNIYQVVNYKTDKQTADSNHGKLGFSPFKVNEGKAALLEQLKQKQLSKQLEETNYENSNTH